MKYGKRCLLLLSSLLAAYLLVAGLGEMYLRGSGGAAREPAALPVAELGYILPPNTDWQYTYRDNDGRKRTVNYHINSLGFRDREHRIENPAVPGANDTGVTRVMLLGDSFLAGNHVEFENLAARLLEHKLNDAAGHSTYEVF